MSYSVCIYLCVCYVSVGQHSNFKRDVALWHGLFTREHHVTELGLILSSVIICQFNKAGRYLITVYYQNDFVYLGVK